MVSLHNAVGIWTELCGDYEEISFLFKLYDLPLEMLDIILQKSYLHWSLSSSKKQKDEDVIRSLISVDVCFNRRITRQRFRKAIWRHLEGKEHFKHYNQTY